MGRIVGVKKSTIFGPVLFALAFIFIANPVSAAGCLRIDKVAEQVSEPSLKCSLDYPQISGLTNEFMQHRLNVEFKEKASIFRTQVKYEAKSGNVEAKMDYKVMRNQNGVMSLVMKERINSGKGEDLTQTGVTIDTVTGRRYFIGDMFIDNADYIATLSAQVKSQIKRQGLDVKQVKEFKSISENADFYLTSDTLVVFLRQGEYFSDECSVREFAIPLKTLEEILKPQFTDKA